MSSRNSSVALLFMRLSLAIFLFAVLTRTRVDPDLWGHLLFGGDIARTGTVHLSDTYSFTSDVPWINHEWLAELLMHFAYTSAGNAGLVAMKSLLLLTMLAMVLLSLRGVRTNPVVHDLLVFLAVAGTYSRAMSFRPQVFSLVLFSILLWILRKSDGPRTRILLLVPIIFALWANLHGGWLVGLGAFGLWCAFNVVRADRFGRSQVLLVIIALASGLATLANPYGVRLIQFLSETVRLSREIGDWQPLFALPRVALIPWFVATFLAIAALTTRQRTVNPAYVAIIALYWIASIRVSRLDAFFVLSVVMLLNREITAFYERVVRRSREPAPSVAPVRKAWIGVALLTMGIAAATLTRSNFNCIRFPTTDEPEEQAARFVKQNGLKGRMLTFFDWGQYAIWHLAPDITVSMDGRRETVYSENLVARHFLLYRNHPGGTTLVHDLSPDYIWLPRRFSVIKNLENEGWFRIFSGPTSVILASSPMTSVAQGEQSSTRRCFPDE
jgi:hypothetical protein